MSKNQHIRTETVLASEQYPSVVYMCEEPVFYGDDVHVIFEGIINPRDEVSIFTKTHLEMNRAQATQLMSALYLALSGKKVGSRSCEGIEYLTFDRDELDEANPIELLKGYQYDEEQALAQHDAWRDEQVEA